MRRVLAVAVVTFLSMFAAATAHAATITFEFTAVQTSTSGTGTLVDLAKPFANISGSFSYDTSVAASSSTPGLLARYPTGEVMVNEFTLASGTYAGSAGTSVINGLGGADAFQITTPGSFPGLSDGVYDLLNLTLFDLSASVFSSEALPTTLALADFSSFFITFQAFSQVGGGSTFLGGTSFALTSLRLRETAPVPEPATLTLLGMGLAAVVLRRRSNPAGRP